MTISETVSATPNDQQSSDKSNVEPQDQNLPLVYTFQHESNQLELQFMSRHSCLASQALCQLQSTGKTTYDFPNIFYTNPRSVVSKIDEIYEVSRSNNIDLICITESWLTENIPDNCLT